MNSFNARPVTDAHANLEQDVPPCITRARAALAVRAGSALLAAALVGLAPVPARAAESTTVTQGKTGSTRVTVVADDENLRFRVPTLIPFVAASDGTLTGPTADATRIENLSAYGLKVTNVRVTTANGWTHGSDVTKSDDSISWSVGPNGSMVDAGKATTATGTNVNSHLWNMTYQSASVETDDIKLATSGRVGRVAQDISSPVQVGTVTFTLAPGAHAQTSGDDPTDDDPASDEGETPEKPGTEAPDQDGPVGAAGD